MSSNDSPEVDVLIATYNGGEWLRFAIDSVISQSYSNWRIVAVDDFSSDNTREILDKYQLMLGSRMKVIKLGKNLRAPGARMEAVGDLSAKYIGFLDQDDVWHNQKLAAQVRYMDEHDRVGAVHTGIHCIDPSGRLLPGSAESENETRRRFRFNERTPAELSPALFVKCPIRLVSALVRRSSFLSMGGFDRSLFGGEDWHFWVRFSCSGFQINYIDQILSYRRVHGMNTSNRYFRQRTSGLVRATELILKEYPELKRQWPSRFYYLKRREVMGAIFERDYRGARVGASEYRARVSLSRRSITLTAMAWCGPVTRLALRSYHLLRRGQAVFIKSV